ncbi:MAG: hypothetical protein IKA48_00490 [Fibrobacter sp.]|nr:hypothetical protein [Fibrobacter sp.]
MAELEITELPGRPLLEDRVKDYPKVQWLLGKYADKAYPIVDKHDIEAVLTELLDDMDRWKGAYHTMKINFNNECDSHAADNERNDKRIKEMEDSLRNMCKTGHLAYLNAQAKISERRKV